MSTIIHTFHKNSVLIKHCPLRHPGYEPGAQQHFVKINPLNELKISTICSVVTLAVPFCGIYLPRRHLDGGLRQTHVTESVCSPPNLPTEAAILSQMEGTLRAGLPSVCSFSVATRGLPRSTRDRVEHPGDGVASNGFPAHSQS